MSKFSSNENESRVPLPVASDPNGPEKSLSATLGQLSRLTAPGNETLARAYYFCVAGLKQTNALFCAVSPPIGDTVSYWLEAAVAAAVAASDCSFNSAMSSSVFLATR